MSEYTATVRWQRGTQPFTDRRYSRSHTLAFDGGAQLAGSASPHVVRVPMADPAGVDPEELFVASLSACHMLWFLDFAARSSFVVDDYTDEALGVMAPDAAGRLVMTVVTLRPRVAFGGPQRPSREEVDALHHAAHAECFIANSVRSDVRIEPVIG